MILHKFILQSLVITLLISVACMHKEKFVDIHGVKLKVFDFGNVPFPDERDHLLATHLPSEIVSNVSDFLHSNKMVEPEAGKIFSARYHGQFLLLDVSTS